MSGFYIKRLKVVGDEKEDTEVIFEKGLNVIHGPSNTGKSYIFQCIDYAFGATKIKNIPESKGYSKLYVEIRNLDNNVPITILRFLNSTDIFYYCCSIDEVDNHHFEKLKSKHNPDSNDNISKFLLKQVGIDENKYLVKNKEGKKVTLSFRAITHLSLISETDIISEVKSPVVETQSTQQTYSKSVLRYLLTNQDDIACVEVEKAEIRKAKNEAKIDYIKEEIIFLNQEKESLFEDRNTFDNDGLYELDYYKEKIFEIEKVIKLKRQELHDINTANNRLNLQKNKIRMMLDKFQLLKRQYLSDMDRLDFSADGESLLSQISTHHCPLCDSEVLKDAEDVKLDEIINCCYNEKAKIQINIRELEVSINDLDEELLQINEMLFLGEEKTKEYNEEIVQISATDLKPIRVVISDLIEQTKIDSKIVDIRSTIGRKSGEIITFEESKKIKEDYVTGGLVVDQQKYKDLCEVIKKSMISCGYSEVKKVTFDVKTQDIEIDGVHRLSNGKGYRAFFYAIFSAALMIYLQNIEHSFMHVLVLDSPLTTLKESESVEASEDDFVDNSLQDGLFTFFAKKFTDKQVIIIDNKQPPKSLLGKYHDITFTKGRSEGRYGFFKVK
ncbi:AAA family ATPase [Clostridium estertheticum]|uniref:AAA family ATPase n=1 Tax=Clostridium estertheticum TaxID=238834 RepID=UPI001CF1B6CC|nr:AAA family ATPase [Clostridium estertheticum]MCB2356416.1 exonuclease [Clostridium estertheticum]WAG39639.1 exonuclease [Clostridium estertheticum]